jgi:hypothetical protein
MRRVRIEESKVISEVWALVYAPAYEPPESGEGLGQENVPRVDLVDGEGDGTYEATYAFSESGLYRVVAYAIDDARLNARPR